MWQRKSVHESIYKASTAINFDKNPERLWKHSVINVPVDAGEEIGSPPEEVTIMVWFDVTDKFKCHNKHLRWFFAKVTWGRGIEPAICIHIIKDFNVHLAYSSVVWNFHWKVIHSTISTDSPCSYYHLIKMEVKSLMSWSCICMF